MKEQLEKSLKRQCYEAPEVEIIAIENQGVLCSSVEDNSRGGTESMNMTNVNWP